MTICKRTKRHYLAHVSLLLLSSSVMSSSFSTSPVGFKVPLVDYSSSSFRQHGHKQPSSSPALVRNSQQQQQKVQRSADRLLTTTALRGGGADDDSQLESSDAGTTPKLGPNAPPPGFLRRVFPTFPWHALPNYLTYLRCLSIPLFAGLFYFPSEFRNRAPVLSAIFALASITDFFDGYLARRWDITSNFGAFLDPVADKLMVSTALVLLSGRYGGWVAIPSSIILAREIGVSALREWMASKGKRESVKVGMQGKVKAALTMVSLTLLLLVPDGVTLDSVGWMTAGSEAKDLVVEGLANLLKPAMIMLYASAVITVTSGSIYFKAAAPVLMGKE